VFLLGLIPLVGATIGAVLVTLVGFTDSWQVALGLGIYYVVYQQIENYLIAPRVMARTVSVPGAIALIAALAGGSLLGILGALVAIPLAAGLLLIVQEVVLPRQERV
jgi:predicted PurR-regulated permease PerM